MTTKLKQQNLIDYRPSEGGSGLGTLSGALTSTANTNYIAATGGTVGGWIITPSSLSSPALQLASGEPNTARIEAGAGAYAGGLNAAASFNDVLFWAGNAHAGRDAAPFRINAGGQSFVSDLSLFLFDDGDTTKRAIFELSAIATGTTRAYEFPNADGIFTLTTATQTITNKTIGSTNTITASDALFTLQDNSDTSKQLQFQLSGISTATTRTLTIPNASGTIALTSDTLAIFAPTTSAQLAGIITDETGSGALVFGTSPTLGGTIAGAPTASGSWTFTGGVVANSAITGNNTINLTGTGASSVAGNFASSGSQSGASQSLTVQNASNTASSNARALITVGGTSAGDPYAYFEIPSGSSWAIGADNSDADAFVISQAASLGTSNVMRIDTNKSVYFYGFLLDVESTTSGGTHQFSLINNSNTANSKTEFWIGTAGASAHDPFIHYNVSGVTDWSHGIDNSDSDAFVISVGNTLGASNAMRIDTSKNVSFYGSNLDFESSNSGGFQSILVGNNSNTASSIARLVVFVAGGSAGDPYTHYLISGVTDWIFGIDNSDSDAWVLAQSSVLGTNNAIRVGTDLIVTVSNILSATTGTSGYIPFSNYLATFPIASTNWTYSFTLQRNITLREFRIIMWVATTNNGSNYWNVKLLNISDSTIYTLGTTSAGAASTHIVSTGNINTAVTVATDSALFIYCEKVGSPGALTVYAPAIYFY